MISFFTNTLGNNLSKIKNIPDNIYDKINNDLNSFMGDKKSQYKIEDIDLDIVGDEKITLENDVTDNYVETNVAYQDQISVKPVTYTISGEVGELVYRKNDNDDSVLSGLPDKLTSVATLLPPTTAQVNSIRNKSIKLANVVNSADNFMSRMAKLNDAPDFQTLAYNRLVKLRNNRTPINIECPWGVLVGFVITRLEFLQKNDTRDKTYITIAFKELKTTDIQTTRFDPNKYNGMEKDIKSPLIEKGQTTGSTVSAINEQTKKTFQGWVNSLIGK